MASAFPSRQTSAYRTLSLLAAGALSLAAIGCGADDGDDVDAGGITDGGGSGGGGGAGGTAAVPHTLFVAHQGALVGYDVASGAARAGTIMNVMSPVDLQVLADGHVLVNLTDRNEVLVVDGKTMGEKARISSSTKGATRPVHLYVTPLIAGKQYAMSLNDGAPEMLATNSATFMDVVPTSPTYLKAVGEVPVGLGHHKAAFSPNKPIVSISHINDCATPIHVYDYSNPAGTKTVKAITLAELAGGRPNRTCDTMARPSPHGAATATATGKSCHNLSGWGDIVCIDQEKSPPTVKVLETSGTGGGYTYADRGGRYLHSLQRTPREGDTVRPGVDCQIGQLVTIDTMTDTISAETPVLYKGVGCTEKIAGQKWASASPGNIKISKDGKLLFVTISASPAMGAAADSAGSDQYGVFDLTNPATPVQKASIEIGFGAHNHALSGDGKWLFVTNTVDATVSVVDVATLTEAKTIKVNADPRQLGSYGTVEGNSSQVGPN